MSRATENRVRNDHVQSVLVSADRWILGKRHNLTSSKLRCHGERLVGQLKTVGLPQVTTRKHVIGASKTGDVHTLVDAQRRVDVRVAREDEEFVGDTCRQPVIRINERAKLRTTDGGWLSVEEARGFRIAFFVQRGSRDAAVFVLIVVIIRFNVREAILTTRLKEIGLGICQKACCSRHTDKHSASADPIAKALGAAFTECVHVSR